MNLIQRKGSGESSPSCLSFPLLLCALVLLCSLVCALARSPLPSLPSSFPLSPFSLPLSFLRPPLLFFPLFFNKLQLRRTNIKLSLLTTLIFESSNRTKKKGLSHISARTTKSLSRKANSYYRWVQRRKVSLTELHSYCASKERLLPPHALFSLYFFYNVWVVLLQSAVHLFPSH